MPSFKPLAGHCQCGSVRFQVTAVPRELYHCHCSMCRRCHGTVFATYATVDRAHLIVEKGEANLARFDSSPPVHRFFCKTCGCQMFIDDDARPDIRYFTPGTIDWPDHAEVPVPARHIFVGSKVPWFEIGDGLPQATVV
ncbi:MAG: GFA family protein [Alphaproteobacteria bacterium]|nr:GFA family protein [Alphaproteobacteria bacterium]